MGKKEEYGIHDGFDIVYETRLVAFLDILGFSRMIHERKDDDVDFIVNLIPDMLKTHIANSHRDDLEVTHVSDSIILSVKTSSGDTELLDLAHICIFIGHLQHEMATCGYYLRGAVTVGPFFHRAEKDLLVGPSFLSAYHLETKESVVPRVIIDNKLKQFYSKDSRQILATVNTDFIRYYYQGDLIRQARDGSVLEVNDYDLFVDYVSSILGRWENGFKEAPKRLLTHLNSALQMKVEPYKYKWLGHYALEILEARREDFEIETRDLMAETRMRLGMSFLSKLLSSTIGRSKKLRLKWNRKFPSYALFT